MGSLIKELLRLVRYEMMPAENENIEPKKLAGDPRTKPPHRPSADFSSDAMEFSNTSTSLLA